jgi:hypothetical protein
MGLQEVSTQYGVLAMTKGFSIVINMLASIALMADNAFALVLSFTILWVLLSRPNSPLHSITSMMCAFATGCALLWLCQLVIRVVADRFRARNDLRWSVLWQDAFCAFFKLRHLGHWWAGHHWLTVAGQLSGRSRVKKAEGRHPGQPTDRAAASRCPIATRVAPVGTGNMRAGHKQASGPDSSLRSACVMGGRAATCL